MRIILISMKPYGVKLKAKAQEFIHKVDNITTL